MAVAERCSKRPDVVADTGRIVGECAGIERNAKAAVGRV
jgi:hypothetical protein